MSVTDEPCSFAARAGSLWGELSAAFCSVARVLLVGLAALPAIGCEPLSGATASSAQAIIDGTAAPEYTGVVYVTHPSSDEACSGTVIAPTLVVTSKHCAFLRSASRDQPLASTGFRVGFGPDLEQLEARYTIASTWVGAPDEVDVQASIEAGEDVAVLTLGEPVPSGTRIHAIGWDYKPAPSDSYELVGYGLTEADGSDWGTKRITSDPATGFDETTGRLEATGNGACRGDSGGPFLYGESEELVAVISEMGASSETTACDLGLTRGSSIVNERVRSLLSEAMAGLPPCSSRAEVCGNQQDENCDGIPDDGCSGGNAGAASTGGGGDGPSKRESAGSGDTPGSSDNALPGSAGEFEAASGQQGGGASERLPSRAPREGGGCVIGVVPCSGIQTAFIGLLGAGMLMRRWRRPC